MSVFSEYESCCEAIHIDDAKNSRRRFNVLTLLGLGSLINLLWPTVRKRCDDMQWVAVFKG